MQPYKASEWRGVTREIGWSDETIHDRIGRSSATDHRVTLPARATCASSILGWVDTAHNSLRVRRGAVGSGHTDFSDAAGEYPAASHSFRPPNAGGLSYLCEEARKIMLCETEQIVELCLHEAMAEEAERRRLHRKPFFRRAEIDLPGDQEPRTAAFCRDISRKGIGLLHEAPLENGSRFTLSMPLIGRNLEVQCKTKWCARLGERWYCSGNAYRCATTPQSLFLLSAVLGDELNRRLHRRYPFFRPVTLEDVQGTRFDAFCRDVSRGGIGFIHRDPIVLGRMVVSIPSSTGEDIVAGADIRRCVAIGQGWYSSGGRFPVAVFDDQFGQAATCPRSDKLPVTDSCSTLVEDARRVTHVD